MFSIKGAALTRPTSVSKPRKRDPEARRREILAAASTLTVERGAAALTHRAVANEAGLGLGTLTRHFPSIEELREATLQSLSEEIDDTLDLIEQELDASSAPAVRVAELIHEALRDRRQVQASMALTNAAVTDTNMLSLALRWTDRLTAILADHFGQFHADLIEVFLNGALVDAALTPKPISQETLEQVIQAILTTPKPTGNSND